MWGFYEDAERVEGAELCEVEGEDAFYDEEFCGGDLLGAVRDAGVGGEVVCGGVDGVASGEGLEVLQEEGDFKRVWVIEVLEGAPGGGEMGEVAVVEVKREEGGGEVCCQFSGEGGFA